MLRKPRLHQTRETRARDAARAIYRRLRDLDGAAQEAGAVAQDPAAERERWVGAVARIIDYHYGQPQPEEFYAWMVNGGPNVP